MDNPQSQKPPQTPSNGGPPTNVSPHRPGSGISLKVAFLWVLVFALLIIGLLGYGLFCSFSQQKRLARETEKATAEAARLQAENRRVEEEHQLAATRQKTEIERQRQETERQQARMREEADLALARNQQSEALQRVRNGTNALGSLGQEIAKLQADATLLSTNAAGQLIALHPDLVSLARRLYENDLPELPSANAINARLESVRRIGAQVTDAAGTAFRPTAEMSVTLQDQMLWTDGISRKTVALQKALAALVRESEVKSTAQPLNGNTPTLAAAIRELTLSENLNRQRTVDAITSTAEKQAADTVAQAEASRILEEAKIKAESIVKSAEEEAAKQKREIEEKTAQAKIDQAKSEVATQAMETEAVKVKLRQKAMDPEIKNKLAPFLTPGTWTPAGMTYEKKPQSYKMLANNGALAPTMEGLQALMDIAYTPADKERPRWRFGGSARYWRNKPEAVAQVREAQQLLIELGDVLVELKLLEP